MIKYIELTRAEALSTQLQEAQYYKITDLGLTNVVSYTSHAVSVGDAETPTLCPVGTVETSDGKFITGRYDLATNTVTAYLEIELLLTQTGTDAPTVTVVKDELGDTWTGNYLGVGLYTIDPDVSALSGYTYGICEVNSFKTEATVGLVHAKVNIGDSLIEVNTIKLSDLSSFDEILFNTPIKIKLYL